MKTQKKIFDQTSKAMIAQKPTEICDTHCKWFWPKEDKSNCQTICPSAGYLLGEEKPEPVTFRITPTERKILRLLALGKSRKEVKRELEMSDDTFQHHVENMRRKARSLEADFEDEPVIDEKEILSIKGMHVVESRNLDSNVYYEKPEKGKIRRVDVDI